MIKRHFAKIAVVTIAVFSCGFSGIFLYLKSLQPIYPNVATSNETELSCDFRKGIGCLGVTTVYTNDPPETVKMQLMQDGIFIHYDQGTNYATISDTHYSLKLTLLGMDNLNFSRVHYLYLYKEEDRTRLTQTVYTTVAIHR